MAPYDSQARGHYSVSVSTICFQRPNDATDVVSQFGCETWTSLPQSTCAFRLMKLTLCAVHEIPRILYSGHMSNAVVRAVSGFLPLSNVLKAKFHYAILLANQLPTWFASWSATC